LEGVRQLPQFATLATPGGVPGKIAASGALAGGMNASEVAAELQAAVDAGLMSQADADSIVAGVYGGSAAINTVLPMAMGPGAQTVERVLSGGRGAVARGALGGAVRGGVGESAAGGLTEALDQGLQNVAT